MLLEKGLNPVQPAFDVPFLVAMLSQPILEFPQFPHKILILLFANLQGRMVVDFFLIKMAAPHAGFFHLFVAAVAGFALFEEFAMPLEIEAAIGIAAFAIQNMVHRHATFESAMSFVNTFENVELLVGIAHGRSVGEK